MKKVLWLFKLKEDFVFLEHYTEMLGKKLMDEGYELHIYDYRKRKLYNMSEKTIELQSNWLNLVDKTPLRIIVNFIYFLVFCTQIKIKYDIVHVLYVRIEYLFVSRFIRSLGSKLVITMFGSDIHSFIPLHRFFDSLYKKADVLHSTILETFTFFLNRFNKKERQEFRQKYRTLAMPLASMTLINSEQKREFVNEILAKYQISDNDLVVVCGTAANVELEQYHELADVLGKTDTGGHENIKFIFPLTYGGSNKDIFKLKKHISKVLPLRQVIVIEHFLPLSELITLRKRTDIFINVRKHDQLVGSMIEAFLCKSEVITGNWLPYQILEENDVYFHKISKIDEISFVLPAVIQDRIKKMNKSELLKNFRVMMQLWGPENTLNEWQKFYQTLK